MNKSLMAPQSAIFHVQELRMTTAKGANNV